MITIYPDTNAFYSDRHLRRKHSRDFLQLLDEDYVDLALSPVVVQESLRHAREAAAKSIHEAKRAARKLGAEHHIDVTAVDASIEAAAALVDARAEEALEPLLEHPAVRTLRWPRIDVQELVQRELDRRRPSMDRGSGTIGLRDTVIWHGLVEEAELESEDFYILVTKDAGFLGGDGLHEDLLVDLDNSGIDRSRVSVQPDLARAIVAAKQLAKLITDREALLTRALIEYCSSLDQLQWGTYYDPRSGGLAEGETSPATLPHYFEDALVASVDYLETENIGEGNPSKCVGYVSLEIDAQMQSHEYFFGNYDDVEWWDGELENPYIGVHTTRRVRVEASIEYDLAAKNAWVDQASFDWA